MRSTTGAYYQALDHVRGVAVFTVFAYHFNHFNTGQLAPPLAFPLSFFTEGFTGVSIFITLSGYLFAKLLDGKKILFLDFIWNRILRLAPLLVFMLLLLAMLRLARGTLGWSYPVGLAEGLILPTLPNGAWSITVEFHFYLILPLLLWLGRQSNLNLLLVIVAAVLLRTVLFLSEGEVQHLAYWTIVGRIDQFVMGIYCFQTRDWIARRPLIVAAVVLAFLALWYWLDTLGGFYYAGSYPSPSPIWIALTLAEAVAYGMAIAWYDSSFTGSESLLSRFMALIGRCSYSIYLLHMFIIFTLPGLIDAYVIRLGNPYIVLAAAVPSFIAFVPVAYVTYKMIEEPFLKYRRPYFERQNRLAISTP